MSTRRRVKRDGSAVSLVSQIPIRLGQRDKNLVALYWLLEIVLTAIVGMDDEHKPRNKKEMYSALTTGLLGDIKSIVQAVNDKFSDQINKTFGEDYQAVLVDVSVAVITLLETMKPEAALGVMRSVGITPDLIVQNWFKDDTKKSTTAGRADEN